MGFAHLLWSIAPHKNGLRIKSAVLGMDNGVSESPIVQSALGSDHGSGTHYRDGDGVVPLPTNDGKEEEAVSLGRVARFWPPPASVTPKRRRPTGVARLHSRRGGQNRYRPD